MTQFSKEQQIAFDKYIQGENIFITGPGGSGKSELIRNIYQDAISKNKNIHVCALTGCAAVLLNCKAKTIHSWAGIGLGRGETISYIKKIRKNNYFSTLWKTTDILVVDEVSMLSFTLFNMLNTIGKHIRNCHTKPFGGIQVIFSGDFYQLPPVGNKEDPDSMRFCFESEEWSLVFPFTNQIQLITIFRQSDPVYSSILNQIREGKMKRNSVNILEQYVGRKIDSDAIIQPTKIYPTKYLVETMNQQNMSRLDTEEKEYQAKQIYQPESEDKDKGEKAADKKEKFFTEVDIQHELDYLASNLICDQVLKLKIGAQVMCIVNMKMDDELLLCNGSQGIVTKFCPITGMPIVKYKNGLEMSMNRHTWVSEKIPGIGISQIPLILAWALTIHKSQGSTLDAAEINVGSDIFECGQTYVALSRVKSLDGLYLTSFNYSKIKINKKVKEFYESFSK